MHQGRAQIRVCLQLGKPPVRCVFSSSMLCFSSKAAGGWICLLFMCCLLLLVCLYGYLRWFVMEISMNLSWLCLSRFALPSYTIACKARRFLSRLKMNTELVKALGPQLRGVVLLQCVDQLTVAGPAKRPVRLFWEGREGGSLLHKFWRIFGETELVIPAPCKRCFLVVVDTSRLRFISFRRLFWSKTGQVDTRGTRKQLDTSLPRCKQLAVAAGKLHREWNA